MKSFLLKDKKPIIKWGLLPNETYFEGTVPEGYSLAVSPWGFDNYIILDVDRHGEIDGFTNLPDYILPELNKTLNYKTKNDGAHYWLKYTGTKSLSNKSSKLGIDLRTNKGYVVWYPKDDIRDRMHEIMLTSERLNTWLEALFSYVDKPKNKK